MKTPARNSGKLFATPRITLSLLTALVAVASLLFISSCKEDEDAPPELTIASISPSTGGAGTVVEITGTGFSTTAAANEVTLTSKVCPVPAATLTKLTITIPEEAGSGNITVKVGTKTTQSSTFTFIPAAIPLTVSAINPTTGPKNTIVTITGTGFNTTAANNVVTINDKPCTVTNATATQLTVVIPASAGSGVLKVTTGDVTVESPTFNFVVTVNVTTLAGSSSGFAEGTGAAAQFAQPYTAAVDADGNVYIADTNNHRIRKITPAGVVTTLAGSTQGDADGTGVAAQFNYPYGVAADAAGNVYVADTHNHKVKKITPAGVVTTVAGSTGGSADGTGAAAQFYYLTGVAVAGDGTIYVADKDNHKIRKVTPNGVVTTFAGSTSGYAEGTGTAAQFSQPYNVTVDANGNVYVADAGNHRIRKITSAGVVTTLAGGSQGDANGTGEAAQFYYPYGVAVDAAGNIFVADTFNQKVRKITPAGAVTNFAGSTGGSTDGAATAAQFNYLTGITVAADGTVFVADKDNHRIRKIISD